MRRLLLAAALAALSASAVAANSGVTIERSVYLEQSENVDGRTVRALAPASELRKGDRVVLMLHWRAPGRGDDFVVSSRIPRSLAFRRSGGRDAQVSVDGGRSWGQLADLRVRNHRATPEDVTHLRWHVDDAEAAMGQGMVSFAAVVR